MSQHTLPCAAETTRLGAASDTFFPEMGRTERQLLVRLQSPPMERLRDAIEAGLRVSRVTNRDGTTV